jgi:diacylglycerol kinase (ATP)
MSFGSESSEVTRALMITNPAAARTAQRSVEQVRSTLAGGGWQIEVLATGGPGDARRLAEQAVLDGMDSVVVFGGDGTTMQAAAALVGTDVSLGIIPGGTGNLLAGNLRIPAPPGRAAEALLHAQPHELDLGRIERDDGTHYFAVACGAGFDARVMAETPGDLKHRWGMAAYVATTLRLARDIRSTTHLITVDGLEYEAAASMVLVANCGEVFPPYIKLRTGISPHDGLLDVIVVRADSFTEGLRAVWELLREGDAVEGHQGYVGYARGKEVRVETDPVEPVQLDGEPGGQTPFTATVLPAAIRVLVPVRS